MLVNLSPFAFVVPVHFTLVRAESLLAIIIQREYIFFVRGLTFIVIETEGRMEGENGSLSKARI